jgi:hypothetical protein
VAQGVDPEFKPQYCQKKRKKENSWKPQLSNRSRGEPGAEGGDGMGWDGMVRWDEQGLSEVMSSL